MTAEKYEMIDDFDCENGDVVIYARYSSDRQNEQSIEGQLRYCYEYAARRGYRVIGEYIDRALSGTKAETRPEFQRMIKDSKKNAYKYILVWKLDRFARNRYDSAIYKNELKKSGVRVVSVTEGVGEDGSESLILEAVLEAMAEEYSRQLSQNVKRGMHETALKGNSVGGNIALGYRVENKKLVIDENEAQIVRYIFKRYAEGIGKKKIVEDLNARGWRTRRGKPFGINSLSATLTNKKYIGVYAYNGEIEVDGGCPAIVDRETFAKTEKMIEKIRRSPAHNKAQAEEYLLAGKAFCGICGAPLVGESGRGRNGTVYNYYACAAKKKRHTCLKKNEKKGFAEWYIVEQTVDYVLTPQRIDYIAKQVVEEYHKGFNVSNIQTLEKEEKEIDLEIDKLVASLIKTDSRAALDRINERLASLELQKQNVSEELAKMRCTANVVITTEDIKTWLRQFCTGDPLDKEFQRRIIDVFINCIYFYDDKVVVYYNIKDGQQISYIDMIDSSFCSDMNADGQPRNHKTKVLWFYFFLRCVK